MNHRRWSMFSAVLSISAAPCGAWARSTQALDSQSCPDGGELRGEAPPRGRAQWCEAVDLFGVVRKNGPFRTWHKNGQRRTDGAFVDGKRHGTWTAYDEDGKVTVEQRYRFDRLLQERRGTDATALKSQRTGPLTPVDSSKRTSPQPIEHVRKEADVTDYLDAFCAHGNTAERGHP